MIGASAAQADKVGSNFVIAKGLFSSSGCKSPSAAGLKDDGFVVAYICWDSEEASGSIAGRRYDGSGAQVGSVLGLSGTDVTFANPAAASADFGKFIVAWDQDRQSAKRDIFARQFDENGSNTGPVLRLNLSTAGDQVQPSVAYLPDGSFVAVWRSVSASGNRIFGQRYSASGARIRSEFQVNQLPLKGNDAPSVAALPNGGFVVVWNSAGAVYGPHGARTEIVLNRHAAPRVAALGAGGFVIVWNRDGNVYGRRYNKLGKPVGTLLLVGTGGGPAIAALPGGGFVVTWEATLGIFGQVYDALGEPAGGSFQVDDGDAGVEASGPTSVAALSSGGFVVAWPFYDGNADRRGVAAQRFSAP